MKNDINNNAFDLEEQLRKLEPDEPSFSFTDNVMQAIAQVSRPEVKPSRISTLWLFLLIPFLAVSIWLISLRYDIGSPLISYWNNTANYLLHLKAFLLYMSKSINNITVSPLVLALLVAAFILLTMDELLNKRHFLHHKNETSHTV
jgi:hypothetical protein